MPQAQVPTAQDGTVPENWVKAAGAQDEANKRKGGGVSASVSGSDGSAQDSMKQATTNRTSGKIEEDVEKGHETDDYTQLTSATHAMYILHLPTTVRKGRCVKKFNCSNEFIVSLTVRLEAVPMRRSNVMHLSIAGLPNSHLPSISVLPGRVKVSIIHATNAPVDDKSGLYAVAHVKQRPEETRFKTKAIYGDANPGWNHAQDFSHLREDETLEFAVYSKSPAGDVLAGKATLPAGSVYPHGFDGCLELKPPVVTDANERPQQTAEKVTKCLLFVSVNTDKACRLVARVEQDNVKQELESIHGIPLQEEVKVEFRLFMVHKHAAEKSEEELRKAQEARDREEGVVVAHQSSTVGKAPTVEAGQQHHVSRLSVHVASLFPEKRKTTRETHEALTQDGAYMMVLRVKRVSQQKAVFGLHVPQPARIFAYMGGPAEPAARAVVSSGMYRWTSHDQTCEAIKEKNMVTFDMPKKEVALLAQVNEEIENNKKWRLFDMVFGFVLLFNGVCIGLSIELENKQPGLVPQSTWDRIDNVLLGVFTLELVLRLFIMGRDWWKFADLWLAFDAFVVVVGYVFLVFEEFVTLPFPVSVLRLLRLFKLAKMVRLVRAFRALGILVEALGKSFSTLFWTLVLLAMMVFVGGVLIVNLVEWQFETPDPNWSKEWKEKMKPWFAVSTATWELLVMTTFDNWADTVRFFAFDVGGPKASLTAICFLIILFFTAIGICNMVVGVMCNTAFLIIQKDTRMKSAGVLKAKQEALGQFRALLKTHNDRPLFKSDRFIGSDELLEACSPQVDGKKESDLPQDVQEMRQCLKILELGSSDLLGLVSIFDESGQIEIDGLVEAIAIVQLQRYFGNLMTANDMIFGKTGLGVRPIDMLFFAFSTREMEASIRSTERSVMGVCSLTMDILHCLDERTKQANSVARMNLAALDVSQARLTAKQVHKWEVAGQKPIGIRPLCKYVTQYRTVALIQGLTLHLDAVFGFFIILNGALVGLQTTDTEDKHQELFYIFDVIFTGLFCLELVLRAILHSNVQDLVNNPTSEIVVTDDGEKIAPEDYDMMRIQKLREKMWFKMVPPWPKGGRRQVIRTTPGFLSSGFQPFDFVIVVVCVIDSLIFAQLRRAGLLNMDPSVFSAVRIFRLVRLAKLLRIFKVFPQLQRLLYVIMSTARLVLFTMLIMLIVLYMFAILMIVCYGDAARVPSDSVHYHYFGGLLNAMLSGWQLLTFDDWDRIFDLARKDFPLTSALVFLPTMVGGLMLMNMAVGVMCASAVSLVTRAARESQYEALLVFISAMGDLAMLLQNELGTQTLLQEMVEAVLELPLRPKKTVHDSRHEGAVMKETSPAMIKAGTEPAFVEKMRALFTRARLQPVMIKHVFEKVDYERQGFVHVNTFIIGALILKEDLAKLDVFASSSALRHMRAKCLEVCHKLAVCHNKMEILLQEMCCLIYRDDYDEKIAQKPINNKISKDYFRLDKDAKVALSRLADWRGEGALPTVRNLGRMNALHGTGRLRASDQGGLDEGATLLEGQHTLLRKEADFGDVIILEQTVGGAGGGGGDDGEKQKSADRKVIPLPIIAVLSDTLVKVRIERMMEIGKDNWEHFFIVRNTNDDAAKKKADVATLVQVPKAHFEPTVSQAVFEWDLTTKMKLRSKLEELEEAAAAEHGADFHGNQSMSHGTKERIVELQQQENATLLRHYAALQQKTIYLHDRSLVFRYFQALKQLMREKPGSKLSQREAQGGKLQLPASSSLGAPVGDAPLQSVKTVATNASAESMASLASEGARAAAPNRTESSSVAANGAPIAPPAQLPAQGPGAPAPPTAPPPEASAANLSDLRTTSGAI